MRARPVPALLAFLGVLAAGGAAAAEGVHLAGGHRLEVVPVLFIPTDNPMPPEAVAAHSRLIHQHVVLAQQHYQKMLETDTFKLSPRGVVVYRSPHPDSYYANLSKTKKPEPSIAFAHELLEFDNSNRIDSSSVYLVVYAHTPKQPWPGQPLGVGTPFHGSPGTGGGEAALMISSLLTDKPYSFQSSVRHELGHAFGLAHVNCHGYDQRTNMSIMSYSRATGSKGLKGSDAATLNPEDFFMLGQNKPAFPNFHYDERKHNPTRKKLTTIDGCNLNPVGPSLGAFGNRYGHGVGFELFVDGKLRSGADVAYKNLSDAREICKLNRKNLKGQKVECRFYGRKL